MQIPNEFLVVLLSAAVAVQGWTLLEVIGLKVKFAALKTMLDDCQRTNENCGIGAGAGKIKPIRR